MFRFADPQYLWLLIVIPFLFAMKAYDEFRQKRRFARIGKVDLVKQMLVDHSPKRGWMKFILATIVVFLIILMLARPQMGTKISHEKRDGIEVVIAMDISNSMLAEDVLPSRLAKTKMLVQNMIDNFTDDKIGLVVFAGDAFVQLPITNDFVSAKMFLNSISPALINTQGTDIGTALRVSASSFTKAENIGRAIILITDGEDHEGGANEAAKSAHGKGINVVVMGIGGTRGAPIPITGGGYLRDSQNNTVLTALNEDMCKDVAAAGKGLYIHVDNTSTAQSQLEDFLSGLQHGTTEDVMFSEYAEQTPWLALLAIILVVAEVLISRRKKKDIFHYNLFPKSFFRPMKNMKGLVFVIVMLQCSFTSMAQTDRKHVKNGNRQFRLGLVDKASEEYIKALDKNPVNSQAVYNYGCALLSQGQDSAAIEQFQNAAKIEKSALRRSMAFHNIGFICQRHQLYNDAIEAYKESLRLNPNDDETRYNLALCQRNQKDSGNGGQSPNKNDDKENGQDKENQNENDSKDNDNNQQKQQNEKMSKDNAERLLNAAMQQERETQERIKNAQQQGSRHLDKNW